MSVPEILVVLLAGLAAGGINAIVGSGSLVTFPVLLAVGFPSVTANVSNTVGLAFGNASAVWGYRRELRGQGRRVALMGTGTALGAAVGALLLLVLPEGVFEAVVPLLILLACFLMARRPAPPQTTRALTRRRMAMLVGIAFAVGVYGGYFGAAQGVILLAALRLLLPDDLQRLNGLKNALAGIANGVAALGFVLFADVAWDAAVLVAVGSIAGATLGARYGRRMPDAVLRTVVVVGGSLVAVVLLGRLVLG
ncbi:sulfite exporter TauE/SafE family protein [Patulibacter sp.]|uniref:sulfite exporter TauE/SafE family protein n=1 Tax=Patulibacter sp. TaxID=1912859 RepID=UPI0027162B5F|nr:sulfite exporter TauE/SafE family protein [Patulibacter sp.]MDO9408815.1 sulfite exporter TauE/SafE family protein [Patulibacter sp.]